MLKIFEQGCKMNAVDDKNNLVGFDTSDDCCAHGGWFVSYQKISEDFDGKYDMTGSFDYPDYEFDTKFFEDESGKDDGIVRFRMISKSNPDLYLHLYNCHNGYYSKGFDYCFGGIKLEGSL